MPNGGTTTTDGHRDGESGVALHGIQAFLYFSLYHCYVLGLLAMMVGSTIFDQRFSNYWLKTWALLYHSVFGLIFLLLSCVLWALKNSRKWSFALSPLILAYTEVIMHILSPSFKIKS